MSGFSSRVNDAINQAAPIHATVATAHRGLSHFVDPAMTGKTRFMQRSGYPFPLLTPQMTSKLAETVTAGSTSAIVSGTRLLPWIKENKTVVSFEALEKAIVLAVVVSDGNLLLSLDRRIDGSHAADTDISVSAFIALPVAEVPAGDGGLGSPEVAIDSPFLVLPGDTFTVFGATYHVSRAVLLSEIPGVMTYGLQVREVTGLPNCPTGTPFIFSAKAAYQSGILNLPHTDTRAFIRGPVAVDVVSSPMVADYTPQDECVIHIEEFDASGRSLIAARPVAKNDVLSRLQINRDQFLFWRMAEGGLDWNGVFTELKAYDSGRAHLWTPCRPPLDCAPLTEKSVVVPSFSPYAVLLNTEITSDVSVFSSVTKAKIPSTDFTVNTTTGAVTFLSLYASTPVVIRYRPRLSWRTLVRPSEPGLELVVVVGDGVKQVFTLGAAGVVQTIAISTSNSVDVDAIHVTARRASDAAGAFKVEMGDWVPNMTVTAAIRYSIFTGATLDFDWAASGLMLKAIWPNLSLVRARLDGESIFTNYLDSGKMLL